MEKILQERKLQKRKLQERNPYQEKGQAGSDQRPLPRHAGHIQALDHARLLAVIFVVLTHTIQNEFELFPGSAQPAARAVWVLAMVCNTLFVMISGALLCRPAAAGESAGTFFRKRIQTVVLPMVLYYCLVAVLRELFLHPDPPITVLSVLGDLFTGNTPMSPQYWLLYLLLSLYLAVPLLRILLPRLTYRQLSASLGIWFLIGCIRNAALGAGLATGCDLTFGIQAPASQWLCIFLLGYWIVLPQSRKYLPFLVIGGAGSAILIALLAAAHPDQTFISTFCCNEAPLMTLTGLGTLGGLLLLSDPQGSTSFAEQSASSRRSVWQMLLSLFLSHAFGIILIHWAVMRVLIGRILGLSAVSFGMIGGTLLCSFLNLLFSLGSALAIDSLMIAPLQKCLRKR